MMFGTNQSRQTARNEIAILYAKIANRKPTDDLASNDSRSLMFDLREMDEELKREMKRQNA